MDVNSDGRLDKAEFTANVRGLFTATDESMKGARMLGLEPLSFDHTLIRLAAELDWHDRVLDELGDGR